MTSKHCRLPAKLRGRGRYVALIVACTASTALIAACGGGDEGADASGGTVTFGANTQLSGTLQIYGLPAVQGVESAAEFINENGGIEVDGETYEAVVAAEDNRSDPSAIVSASRAVVDSGAIAALGPDLGANPSYEVFQQNEVITFTPAFDLQLELLSDPESHPLLFSPTVFLAELFVTNMKQLKSQFAEIETVAILAPNDEQGQGSAGAYQDAAEQEGLEVVANESFPPNATDFTSVLTQFRQQQPDLLIALQSAEQATAILQQAAQLDIAPYGLNDVLTPDQVFDVQGLGDMTLIIPNFSPTFSPSATIPDYDPEPVFRGEEPAGSPGAAINMFYAFILLAQAIEEAGTISDTTAIAEALPGQSYDGPFGTCTMSERRELDCETIVYVVEGEEITVHQFPDPDSVEPMATYLCRQGECEAQ
ncbi:MAG TPA: ABC transporter substrate-binding protein [Solirubrobacterales bacterium]|nr:ABC transporter substrate-binding protein [Solirubrobacterales bacterium]